MLTSCFLINATAKKYGVENLKGIEMIHDIATMYDFSKSQA